MSVAGAAHTEGSASPPDPEDARRVECGTLADVAGHEAVILASHTPWQVAWELMMLGPFEMCVLRDGPRYREINPAAMLRSAMVRRTPVGDPLVAEDYTCMTVLAPRTSLDDAARTIVEVGWNEAVITGRRPRLLSARALLRALLCVDDAEADDPTG